MSERNKVTTSNPVSATMRVVLLEAHKRNNNKPIDKKICEELGVSEYYYKQWKDECFELYRAVGEYIRIKYSKDINIKTETNIKKTKDLIMKNYISLLLNAEEDIKKRTIKAEIYDLENLIGYADVFIPTARGTRRGINSEVKFRKLVESLLGLKIAMNEQLAPEKRDIIVNYEKKLKSIDKHNKRLEELNSRWRYLYGVYRNKKDEEYREYLNMMLKVVEDGDIDDEQGIRMNGIKQLTDMLEEEQKYIEEYRKQYMQIFNEIEKSLNI